MTPQPVSEVLGQVVYELETVFGRLDALGRHLGDLAADATAADRPLHRDDLAALRPEIFEVLAVRLRPGAGARRAPRPCPLPAPPRRPGSGWGGAGGPPPAGPST